MCTLQAIQHSILLIECLSKLVAAKLHLLELPQLPSVHFEGSNKRDMDAHASVVACALVAKEDAYVGRAPLRVLALAVEAGLQKENNTVLLHDRKDDVGNFEERK